MFLLCNAIATFTHRDSAAYFVAVEPSYHSSCLENFLIYYSCFSIISLRRRRPATSVHGNSLQLPTKWSFDASSYKPSLFFSFIMASPSPSKPHKVIIVGAGINGILAPKTYLQIKPDVDISHHWFWKIHRWCLGGNQNLSRTLFLRCRRQRWTSVILIYVKSSVLKSGEMLQVPNSMNFWYVLCPSLLKCGTSDHNGVGSLCKEV